jgi:tetratricopeptide (TPR) repeat protein
MKNNTIKINSRVCKSLFLIFCLMVVCSQNIKAELGPEDKTAINNLINEGINYHSNRNYLLAMKSFLRALDIDPNNKQILNNLSITHNNYGKYLAERTDGTGAAREFRNALYYNPDNNVARSNLEVKLKEMKIDVKDPVKRILQAKQERIAENFLAAISELNESNRLKETTEAYLEIGTNYHLLSLKSPDQQIYIDKAVTAFNRAIQLEPEDPRPLIRLGDVYVASGKISMGIDFYQQAIKKDPASEEAQSALINGWLAAIRVAPHLANNHVGLGTAYQLKGDFLQAERSFRRALQIDANNQLANKGLDSLKEDRIKTQVALFLDRAVKFQKQGNLDESLANYIRALNLEPTNADIHYNIGTAFQAKKDFERAQKAYNKAIELNPNHQEAKEAIASLNREEQDKLITEAFAKAVSLQQSGSYNEALAIYNRISKDRPQDDTLFYNIGVAYQALNQYELALENYLKAYGLREDPNYQIAIKSVEASKANKLLEQAISLQSGAQNREAIAKYLEVVRLVPENANAWYNLGTAYQAIGQDLDALDAYKKAYGIDEKNQTEAIFFAALILEDQRKLLDAINLYDKYLKIAPNGEYKNEARDRQAYIKGFL